MKINFHTANDSTIFFAYCDSFLRKAFDRRFFDSIGLEKYEETFKKYETTLAENGYFSYVKDLAFSRKHFEQNADVTALNEQFKNVDLNFWKDEYEKFTADERFNIHIADKTPLQYFGFALEKDIDVVLVPKNSCNDLRMHSGVTNTREKDIIFIFVPEYKEGVPYKRLSLEVLLHEIVHLYIYRSEWYKKICTLALDGGIADKKETESVSNELLARVFLTPNTFGLLRANLAKNLLAERPLREPLNMAAHAIVQEVLDKKIEKINDEFVGIFMTHLRNFLTKKS